MIVTFENSLIQSVSGSLSNILTQIINSMSKHFSKTEFEYPVHRICGKIAVPFIVPKNRDFVQKV